MFERRDGLDLAGAQAILDQQRKGTEARPERRSRLQPLIQRLRPVEAEQVSRAAIGIRPIAEQNFRGARLIIEAQRIAPGREMCRKFMLISACLVGHSRERIAFRFGFHDPAGLAVDKQEIVTGPRRHGKFANGYTKCGAEVHVVTVLHHPAGLGELGIDQLACAFLRLAHGSPIGPGCRK